MSRKQSGKPIKGNRKYELERKRDERAARRALAKDKKNRPPGGEDGEEFVSFSNQLQALGLKLREVPGDGYVWVFCYRMIVMTMYGSLRSQASVSHVVPQKLFVPSSWRSAGGTFAGSPASAAGDGTVHDDPQSGLRALR